MEHQTDTNDKTVEIYAFELGDTFTTRQISEDLANDEIISLFRRHASCDWSDMCLEDQEENALAIRRGDRVFSSYLSHHGKVWIVTEADRSCTTLLYPHEY